MIEERAAIVRSDLSNIDIQLRTFQIIDQLEEVALVTIARALRSPCAR
ncbi:MAG: hypothetical protein ABSC51_01880 [Gaiellaceae bacterium]